MTTDERRRLLICCRCDVTTAHHILCSAQSDYRHSDAEGFYMHEPATYSVLCCDGCAQISMYIWSPFHKPESEFGERLYPELVAEESGIPAEIASAYREADRIKHHSTVAYAVMARRVLELIAKERGVRERNLAGAMASLVASGVIPPVLAEAATLIRIFGNMAAHPSGQSLNAWHVSLIEKFLNVLVEYVYVAPAALQEFKIFLDIDQSGAEEARQGIHADRLHSPLNLIGWSV